MLFGRIGDLPVQMSLSCKDNKLSGNYYYQKSEPQWIAYSLTLALSGNINAQGNLTLQESNPNEEKQSVTGKFTGTVKSFDPLEITGSWSAPNGKRTIPFTLAEAISVHDRAQLTTEKFNEPSRRLQSKIKISYPQLSGATAFNTIVKTLIFARVKQFREVIGDVSGEAAANIRLEIGYSVVVWNDTFISVLFDEYAYAGGPHPNADSFAINFDLKQERLLTLDDLFKPDVNYLRTINGIAHELVSDLGEYEIITAKDKNRWYPTPGGLVLLYSVSHAAGDITPVYLPATKLRELINRASPIAACIK